LDKLDKELDMSNSLPTGQPGAAQLADRDVGGDVLALDVASGG
jgi:hypothetical protein